MGTVFDSGLPSQQDLIFWSECFLVVFQGTSWSPPDTSVGWELVELQWKPAPLLSIDVVVIQARLSFTILWPRPQSEVLKCVCVLTCSHGHECMLMSAGTPRCQSLPSTFLRQGLVFILCIRS